MRRFIIIQGEFDWSICNAMGEDSWGKDEDDAVARGPLRPQRSETMAHTDQSPTCNVDDALQGLIVRDGSPQLMLWLWNPRQRRDEYVPFHGRCDLCPTVGALYQHHEGWHLCTACATLAQVLTR